MTFVELLPVWGLAAARLAGFVLLAPPFGYVAVPWPVRVGVGAVLAVPAAGLAVNAGWEPPSASAYPAAWVAEVALGLLMGLLVAAVFYGAQIAGDIIGRGASLGSAVAAEADQPSPAARLYLLLALATLLLVNGHLVLVEDLCAGFRALPPGSWAIGGAQESLVRAVGTCFAVALAMVAPVVALLFAWEIVAALLARAAPLWCWPAVAETVRPGAGLLALAVSLPLVWRVMVGLPDTAAELVRNLISSLAGG